MDLITALDDAGTEFGRLVDGTRADQLDLPTPCARFTVRELINHVTAGATMFAWAFEQGSVPDAELAALMGDVLGDDPSAAYAGASERVQAAYHAPGALDGNVTLPFGEMPRAAALSIAAFDVAVHAWDLAHATGQDLTLPDAHAVDMLALGEAIGIDGFRDGDMFADAVAVSDAAPAWDRLAAFSGRQP